MKSIFAYAALAASAAILAGCSTTAGTSIVTNHADGSSALYEGNTRLANRVSVDGVTYDRTPTGMNRVNMRVSSLTQKTQDLQYRISWYNSEGMEIDGASRTYRPLILQGMDTVTVTGVANSPEAVKSRIRIREAGAADR